MGGQAWLGAGSLRTPLLRVALFGSPATAVVRRGVRRLGRRRRAAATGAMAAGQRVVGRSARAFVAIAVLIVFTLAAGGGGGGGGLLMGPQGVLGSSMAHSPREQNNARQQCSGGGNGQDRTPKSSERIISHLKPLGAGLHRLWQRIAAMVRQHGVHPGAALADAAQRAAAASPAGQMQTCTVAVVPCRPLDARTFGRRTSCRCRAA